MLVLLLLLAHLQPVARALVAEGRVTAKGLEESGLALIPSGSSDFPRLLDRLVGKSRFGELDAVLPYSVVLVNKTKKRIVFYAVRWTSTSSKGTVVHDDRMYHNLGTLRGGYAVDPGGTCLISVVDALNKPLNQAAQSDFVQQFNQSRMDLQFLKQSQVTISLDVAIFANGEVVGPDTSGSVEQAQERLDSARDLYAAYAERRRHHQPDQVYVTWLRELVSDQRAIADPRGKKWYRYYTQHLAAELISVHEQGGDSALQDRLHEAYRPKFQLHR